MWPKLFEHDGVVIHTYGLFMFLSVCLAIASLFTLLAVRRQNLAPALDLTLLMILGYTLVARFLYALLGGEWEFFTHPSFAKMKYGFWGAPVAFALLSGGYLLASRAPMRVLGDALAVTWAAVTVLHKVACFFSGCCHGAETAVPWALVFPEGGMCGLPGRPIHPTQLYDAGAAFLIAGALLAAFIRGAARGRLLLWWGTMWALSRFLTEWTRGDARFAVAGPLTASMFVELLAVAAAVVLLARPRLWECLADVQEGRARPVPPLTIGRGLSLAIALANFGICIAVACAAEVAARGWGLVVACAYLVIAGALHPGLRLLGWRLVNAAGEPAPAWRHAVRGLAAVPATLSLVGVFRPVLDAHGRSLADAIAGTWVVRR